MIFGPLSPPEVDWAIVAVRVAQILATAAALWIIFKVYKERRRKCGK